MQNPHGKPHQPGDGGGDSPPRPDQQSSCPLLHVPADIFFLIFDRLEPQDRFIFAQTCRAAWNSLRPLIGRIQQHLTSRQHHLYLVALARCEPDSFACGNLLHAANGDDTPTTAWHAPYCPAPGPESPVHCTVKGFFVAYRHVQLTLKYVRLLAPYTAGGHTDSGTAFPWKRQQHLAGLLAPYHRVYNTWSVHVHFEAHPKVVRGRYLLLLKWSLHRLSGGQDLTPWLLPNEFVCRHQGLLGWCRASQTGRGRVYYDHSLRRAVYGAFDTDGKEVDGSCALCTTDFSVSATPALMVVCAWQSFGREGPPGLAEWKSHVAEFALDGVVVHHWGAVRRLYEREGIGNGGVFG